MSQATLGPVEALLGDAWRAVAGVRDGTVASYIPELAKADPATFGMSVATVDGQVYSAGELVPFTIQSVSKPFVYALALADCGPAAVLAKVGVEPSGDPFNTISLDDVSGRPYNPMVNAGAIVTTSLLGGMTREQQLTRLLDGLSDFAGRVLQVDERVFESERDTGDRNRAIAYLMRSAGLLDEDVDAQVDLYFRQCSVLVTAADLAVMAATLANGGRNPVTGKQVVPVEVVKSVLTIMTTCGMYDYAGQWLYRVGVPAKSGVSGGIAAALPGQFGLGVHSPPLDRGGNSVRGVTACEWISDRFGLHLLLPGGQARSALRRTYRGDTVRSKRTWGPAQRELLDSRGAAIVVIEVAGDQSFASAELLARTVRQDPLPAAWCILDLLRVTGIDTASSSLLAALVADLATEGVGVAIVEPAAPTARGAARELGDTVQRFGAAESALEWAESQLLLDCGIQDRLPDQLVPFGDQELMRDLPADVVAAIEARTVTKVFTPGAIVFDEGAEPDGLYFLSAGEVTVDIRVLKPAGRRRLSTIGAGSSFGELALVDGRTRSARVVAIEPVMCHVLSTDAFADLLATAPASYAYLTLAIARNLSLRLRYSTAEVAAFEAS